MRREVSLEEISDGRLYELNDMVKADCQDCAGCHDCCEGMGDSVVLDPMDVYRLCTNLGKTPQELVSTGLIQFDAMDGNILPHLCMSGKKQCCVFLRNRDGAASMTSVLVSADFSHWDVSMKMEDLSIFCRSMNVRRQAGARSR